MSPVIFDVRDIPVLTDAVDVAATNPSIPAAPAEAAPAETAPAETALAEAAPAAPAVPVEPIEQTEPKPAPIDIGALQSAILQDVLALAHSLTSQANREIENLLYELVFEQLRAQLPELVERSIRAHLPGESDDADEPGEPDG
jgi:hypothetical protein